MSSISCVTLVLKGFPATAALLGVGIGYTETAVGQLVLEINDTAAKIVRAERIDEYIRTEELAGQL